MKKYFFASSRLPLILSIFLAFVLAFEVVSPAQAEDFPPVLCPGEVGDSATLVAQVAAANSNGQPDTITLVTGCTYTLPSALIIGADGGNLLTIQSSGGAMLAGSGSDRVLHLNGGANVVINNLTLTGGSADLQGGGAIRIEFTGTLTINSSLITGNQALIAGGEGGGIFNDGTLTINSSTIRGNQGVIGGGIRNVRTLTINSSRITNNQAAVGGGISSIFGDVFLNDTLVSDNRTINHPNVSVPSGAGFHNTSRATINRSAFINNNTASNGEGGGIYSGGNLTINNSTFSGNSASIGGGFYNSTLVTFNNSTLMNNTASLTGGGVFAGNTVYLYNTVIANNTGTDCGGSARPESANNLVKGGGCGLTYNSTTGNLRTLDPLLGPLTNGRYFPITNPNSPLINAGSDSFVPDPHADQVDQVSNPRIQQGRVDIGAVESPFSLIPTVTISATVPTAVEGDADGVITFTRTGNTINPLDVYFADGGANNALEGIDFDELQGTTSLTNHVTIPAGQPSAEMLIRVVDDLHAEADEYVDIFISPDGSNYVIGTADHATVTIPANDFVVINPSDFDTSAPFNSTLREGTLRQAIENANNLPGDDTITFTNGVNQSIRLVTNSGALIVQSSALVIEGLKPDGSRVTLSGNQQTIILGNNGANTALRNLTFIDGNNGNSDGGAIFNNGGMTISNSAISSSAAGRGGGLYNLGTARISNSTISGNTVVDSGGGVFNSSTATLTITNSTISGNTAGSSGGGIFSIGVGTTVTLLQVTVSNNSSGIDNGSGGAASFTINNSILANSTSGSDCSGSITANFSLIETGCDGLTYGVEGNRRGEANLSPLTDGYHTPNVPSPAVNGGSGALAAGLMFDQIGNDRVGGGRVDMGSIETTVVNPIVTIDTSTAGNTAPEGGSSVSLTITRTGDPSFPMTVTFNVTGTTTPGDYSLTDGTNTLTDSVTIPAGASSASILIAGADDIQAEADETIIVTLEDGGDYDLGAETEIVWTVTVPANDFVVTNFNDFAAAAPANERDGTLRQAIENANATGGAQTISFTVSNVTIALSGGELVITNNGALTIDGATITVSGNNASRVFRMDTNANVTINGMHITGGNSATSGGGILVNSGANLDLNGATVTGNKANSSGGGIDIQADASVTLNDSTISENTGNASGGGVSNSGGIAIFNRSTLLNNTAGPANSIGGGLVNSGLASFYNSTIAGNSGSDGAGIYSSAILVLRNTTITANTGRYSLFSDGSTTEVRNTIIANTMSGVFDCVISGGGASIGYTLVGDGSCGVGTGPTYDFGNLSGDPLLPPTGTGNPPYYMPGEESPVIDAGDSNNAPDGTDQAGGQRIRGLRVDMGSVETNHTPRPIVSGTKTVSSTTSYQVGTNVTYTVTLLNAGAGDQPNNPTDEFTDVLPAGVTLVSATASSGTAGTSGNTVTWNGSIPGFGGTVTITITATINSAGVNVIVSNQGSISYDRNADGTNDTTVLTDDPNGAGENDPTIFAGTRLVMSATKTVSGIFQVGHTVTYTVTINNPNAAPSANNSDDEFIDTLPFPVTLVNATANVGTVVATIATNNVTWNGSIPASSSATITITATINAGTVGLVAANQGILNYDNDLDGTSETSMYTDDPSVGGTSDPTVFTVIGADVSATKAVNGTFTVGSTVTYTIELSNSGTAPAPDSTGNEFTDVLPSQLTLVSADDGGHAGTIGTSGNTVTWNGAIADDSTVTITITATINVGTSLQTVSNQGTFQYDANNDGTNETSGVTDDPDTEPLNDATVFVVDGANVSATKTVLSTAVVGANVTYTIQLGNSGNTAAPDNAADELTDVLPSSLTLTGASADVGVATTSGNTVTWNGSVPIGTNTVTITITATINAGTQGTTISNQGTVSYDADVNGSNEATRLTDDPATTAANDPTSFTVIIVSVSGTKSVSGTFRVGGTVTYTIVLTNNGTGDQADNLGNEFADGVPDTLTVTDATASGGLVTRIDNQVTWNGAIPVGSSVTLTITAMINAGAQGMTISNAGGISFDADLDGTNEAINVTDDPNTPAPHDATVFVVESAQITATKAVSGSLQETTDATYTITLSNAGTVASPDNAGDEFNDVLPSQLTLVSATASSGTATTAGNTVTWNGSVPAGGSVTITIVATINAGTTGLTVSNQGTVSYDQDLDGTNETTFLTDDPTTTAANDPTVFTVLPFAELSVSSVSQAEGNSGTTSFSFVVSLSAPAGTDGVSFDIATHDASAMVADNDYVAQSLTAQTIPAGSSSYSFDVIVNGDLIDEGDETFTVDVSNVTGATVTSAQGIGTIGDDDTAGIVVEPTEGLETSESGDTATFTVVINTQPTDDVVIDLSSDNEDEGTVDPAALTFTPANWDVPQTVTVTGVDDALIDGDVAYTIVTAAAISADAVYDGFDADDVSVTNLDDDVAGISVSPTEIGMMEGGTGSYEIALTNPPSNAPVTVQVSFDSTQITINGSASPLFLNFSSTVPQFMEVKSLVSDEFNNVRSVSITHVVSASAANEYPVGLQGAQVVVNIGDTPPPPPTPLCETHNFDEGGIVRASTSDAEGYAINCRVLYQNGSPTQWMGGDLYNGGSIGVEGIFDLGVQQAVDIFSPPGLTYFTGGAVFCLRGSGWLIWLAGSGQPRHAEIIGSYVVPEFPGFTCATLFEPGTLVLVSQNPVR